ncbi:MAG: NfeD family protein [Planctomycetota bacterium]
MYRFPFQPMIDIPLTAVLAGGFILAAHYRVNTKSEDLNVDLASRLPQARFRIAVFFVTVLLIYWMLNLGVWAILLLSIAGGIVLEILFGQGAGGGVAVPFGVAAFLLIDWAFGFPELILSPSVRPDIPKQLSAEEKELIGKIGITSSPLRPAGNILVDDREFLAVSEDGQFIDTGKQVQIVDFRNGQAVVAQTDTDA